MADLDWVSCAVVAVSVLLGLWRGLAAEVLSLLNWLVAFFAAQFIAPQWASTLPMQGASQAVRYAAAFVMGFVACLLAGFVLIFLLKKVIEVVGLRPIDRVLGAVFGAARGALILMAATVAVTMTPLAESDLWQDAQSPRMAQTALTGLKPLLPQAFARFIP